MGQWILLVFDNETRVWPLVVLIRVEFSGSSGGKSLDWLAKNEEKILGRLNLFDLIKSLCLAGVLLDLRFPAQVAKNV